MEAVKIDTLPSTESNKLCSLLSTDARDSNDISKEKEEELLYGAGEDVDEDEALSDDSLRLQFSDDEEADQDDADSSEHVYKPVKEEATSDDEKFETSVTLSTNEEKLSCQESSADQGKFVTEEEKCEEQAKLADALEESKSLVEGAHDQDTIMNGNDPRYFQSVIRPSFENRWRQNSPRQRMSFNNHHQHQRSYYQNSSFGPSESDSMNNRYYNKQSHYGRSRGSGKPHHQNYNEHNNWNSKSRSLDRRKDATTLPTLKVIETSEKSEEESKDSASKELKTESIASDENGTISDIKIKDEETNEEEIAHENCEKEKENLKDSSADSKSLPVESPLSEEVKVSDAENVLMETDEEKNPSESANAEEKENSAEKNPEPAVVDEEPIPSDEYAHLNEETGVLAGSSTDLVADKNDEQSSSVENSESKESEVVGNETNDDKNVPIPDNDPENCEEDEENLGFETPTEDALSRKGVVSDSDSAAQYVPKISDVPISMNEDSESAIENLPKVYQCLEEIAHMEASRLAKEMEQVASVERLDVAEETTENCKMNTSLTPEISTKDMTENCNLDVSKTPETIAASMEEDNSLQDGAVALKESEELKESELLNDDGENSNCSMHSAATIIVGPPEATEELENEVEKMDFDDNACQSNEDAKAADGNKETLLADEGANDINMASISDADLIMDEASNEVSNDASNDVSNDVSNDIDKKVVEDDSNSGNSLFTEKKEQNSEEDLKKDTSHHINNNQVVDMEEKMCVDDSECLDKKSDTWTEKRDVEAITISNDGCSNESQESSIATSNTMEVGDDNESKTDDGTSTVEGNQQPANAALQETTEIPETASTQGETSGRQKRKTAKNAEEIIRTKFLGGDSDVESDDSGKFVSVNYRSKNNLRSLSPPSLKRNLTDDDDSSEGSNVKKIKMTLDLPKHLISKFDQVKEEDPKVKESIRNLTNVRKFFQRDVKGQLKKLTQEELEELLIQKIVETITMSSEIGKLREQARLSEKNQEATRTRCQQLAKQIQDFEMVLKRNAADRSAGNDKYVAPIKINRSVGLQVNFISDHGMQNMRQMQQNVKPSLGAASVGEGTANPRRGIKVRSPRRSEVVTSALMTPAVQPQAQTPTITPVTPAALVSTKVEPNRLNMPVQTASAQPVISSINIRSPNKMGSLQMMQSQQQLQQAQQTQQTIILNGNIANRLPTAASLNVQKPKSNDLIDLTDEEEKTKTTVSSAPMTVTTATLIANSQNQRTLMQGHSTQQYQRVIQVPSNVALSNQATNIRVVQPNSQSTPTALVNNINAPRFTYVMQSGGGPPRQILIANPNSIRQGNANRNQFPTLAYKSANGIPTSANGTLRLLTSQANANALANKHPAPLPDPGVVESNPNWKLPPPAPSLKISKVSSGIVLSWNMTLSDKHADIVSYQLFAYQEVSGTPPSTLLWKKVGDVMSLPLPMACTLTQFSAGNNYYFAVRAVDTHSRLGQYSVPGNISL